MSVLAQGPAATPNPFGQSTTPTAAQLVQVQTRLRAFLSEVQKQPLQKPSIVCGMMTLIPVEPSIDPKIRKPAREDSTRFVIQSVTPTTCTRGQR
jgi:hypothetical protein